MGKPSTAIWRWSCQPFLKKRFSRPPRLTRVGFLEEEETEAREEKRSKTWYAQRYQDRKKVSEVSHDLLTTSIAVDGHRVKTVAHLSRPQASVLALWSL